MSRSPKQFCFAFLVAFAAIAHARAVFGADEKPLDALFAQYPVADVYHGPVRLPDFKKRDRSFSTYRTRIREGLRGGANLAGHYALIGWGCGTECVNYVVGDVRTGRMFDVHIGGDDFLELKLDVRLTSRFVVANWVAETESAIKGGDPVRRCLRQDFLWTGSLLMPLAVPKLIGTVDRGEINCDP